MKRRLLYIILTLFLIAACTPKQPETYMLRPHEDPENCWSLWEADLWKMQKAFADYAALDRPAECQRAYKSSSCISAWISPIYSLCVSPSVVIITE